MSLLSQGVVLLASAVVAVPLLKRFGLASVLGYLAAGVAIGPWGLRLIDQPEAILHTTEFGVVLLLFIIGLELQPSRLWVLRRAVFGLGGAQVLLTSLLLGGAAWLLGLPPLAAMVAGLALSLSSTAFVLQMLAEKHQLTSRHGRDGFAVLLFQDLAVIPLLAILPLLSPAAAAASRPSAWVSLAAVLGVALGGRYVLRAVLRRVARANSHELFVMATLLIVMATAWGLEAAGLSMSLGAFLAGVLLADSEYRHELEANIEPFKGVLLGLFFVAVGMAANLGLLLERPFLLLGLALGLMAVKALVLHLIGKLAGMDGRAARRFAVYLAQGGEFAFVLLTLAVGQQLMDERTADLLAMVVTLSMALTPLLVGVHERWVAPRLEGDAPREFDQIDAEDHSVIIAGFGRFGQIVARVLRTRKISATVLESSFEQVDFVRRFGNRIHYGDASRLDLLRAAGAERAKLFVLAIDDVEASLKTAATVRQHFPHLKIYARARNRFHYYRLRDLGVEAVTRETFAASLEMSGEVLQGLGISAAVSAATLATFRQHDEALLVRQYAVHHDETALIQTSRDAMRELEDLFEADVADSGDKPPGTPGIDDMRSWG
ncbi:glutathione-regulated potassium-efflux system protein KefB [Chitinimonas arctica]|uniref:Glutathione-regulated potassium-efflux system protein KefB n=1 Tax=Chitinimonas arctica TaxID=2594795 RepID=A0A516SDS3_9NEIS|nr:monovalent cation:proton antiporter-2 (CPA2) family protein [Chitinimonas arctica]QDQ26307.1 glutathione-regulated potassium-efflux system protein KefB [Chitinimonas arctica]